MAHDVGGLKDHIRDIPDFPRPGVVFKDITPLLADGPAFALCVDALADHFADLAVDKVFGVEARGFIIAAPVAVRLGAGFVPLRKPGKLPWTVERQDYLLEYGTDRLEVHADAVTPRPTGADHRRRAGHRRDGRGGGPAGRSAGGHHRGFRLCPGIGVSGGTREVARPRRGFPH